MTKFKDQFLFPVCEKTGSPKRYLCGHSLGLQPKATRSYLEAEMKVWETKAVDGHFHSGDQWYTYNATVTDSLAKITGAKPSEVVAMNSLTTNLHLLMTSFYQPTTEKHKILVDFPSFPSDKYAIDSIIRLHGYSPQESLVRFNTLLGNDLTTTKDWLDTIEAHKKDLCLVYLNPVNYLTGQWIDVAPIAKRCQELGIRLGLDLAHSIGNVELHLNAWEIDFAFWCTYKYLNSGPGGIGGAFVHEKHHTADLPRLEGWWGTNSETRFQMSDTFESANTADAWQLSNPPILLLATLRASLEIFDQTSITELRHQGDAMTQQFIDSVNTSALKDKMIILNETCARGNMLCIRLTDKNSKDVHTALAAKGIVLDHRQPDILRFSFCPLYNTAEDVTYLSTSLREILVNSSADSLMKRAG